MKTNRYDINDVDNALADILARVEKLREGLGGDQPKAAAKATEQPATTAPDAGSDGRQPDVKVEPEGDLNPWRTAYFDLESDLHEVVMMVQVAHELVFEADPDEHISFTVAHSRNMLDAFEGRYREGMDRAIASGN